MKDVSIGQYYAADSPVHRLDPRIKLVLTIAYIVLVFFLDTFFAFGVTFLLLIALAMVSRIPILKLFRSLRAILFLLAFTLVLTVFFYRGAGEVLWEFWVIKIYDRALINSGMLACRLVLLIIGPTLLTLTTTPVELTDAIERLLKPLSWIKFPVHEFAMIMSIALRLIPTLSEETTKIISAQKARCADFESGNLFRRAKALLPILIPLFVSSFRRADELADAMDSRCYRGAKNRTRMKIMKLKWGDFFAFLIVSAVFFAALVLRFNILDSYLEWLVWFKGVIV
ncbi:MAG: energy-coupling factor transporter transmembrane protein EcfT [Firmicutes bacterium]|nr:energy-coupling factor transporter transmembrane protein EcfT [Bacillota bacterium]